MSAVRRHMNARHPDITEKELQLAGRDGTDLRELHHWWHTEYSSQQDHTHDEHGQIHDREKGTIVDDYIGIDETREFFARKGVELP